MRNTIYPLISDLHPFDALEERHRAEALRWIDSGAPIFRLAKPNIPDPHLVCYGVLLDLQRAKILLVDHRKADLWLAAGGHVDPDEDPAQTVRREIKEELAVTPTFLESKPFFITITPTTGTGTKHTDVSLWYLLSADSERPLKFDSTEFRSVRWFGFDEVPFDRCDPHMGRFLAKLQEWIRSRATRMSYEG